MGICITRIKRPDTQLLKAYKSLFLSHLRESVLEASSSGPQGHPGTQGPVLQSPRKGVFSGGSTDPQGPQIEFRRGNVNFGKKCCLFINL